MSKAPDSGHIYTVSELTRALKALLERRFAFVWVQAEISNFRMPSSGHYYFALKDEEALLRAVMFRGQNRQLRFMPEDGMRVLALGRLSIYSPRGEYQLIVEHLQPEGVGALQIAFEQLREKLALEGLFDKERKQSLPFLPTTICLVTSPTGAVVFDILNVLGRRFENLAVEIVPVKVQGEEAPGEIAAALDMVNRRGKAAVIILARGGGSLEDLWAFNTELVARAIAASRIPLISAIGHETDYTIADMVADVRAPTPSAAAEIVVPVKEELLMRCDDMTERLTTACRRRITEARSLLARLTSRLVDPRKTLQLQRDRLMANRHRLQLALTRTMEHYRHRNEMLQSSIDTVNPIRNIREYKAKLEHLEGRLRHNIQSLLHHLRGRLQEPGAKLSALDPHAVLQRGYSITRNMQTGRVVTRARTVPVGQELEIILARGSLTATTTGRHTGDQPPQTGEKVKGNTNQ